jgi:hypothetical protein
MANVTLTPDIIAAKAIDILDNNLVMAKKVYRGHESEFAKKVNGYKVGETVSIRRPNQFTVREGATAAIQDVVEGTTTMTIDKQRGVDFKFSSTDMTLEIDEFEDRILKDAMIKLANRVDTDLMALYKNVYNYVGPSSGALDSFADFSLAPERLDLGSVPMNDRCAILSPTDFWGLVGSQTGLYVNSVAQPAYREGSLGMIGGIDTYMSQNTPTHTAGTRDISTPKVKGTQSTTWAASKDTNTMSLDTDGWDTVATLTAGDVFTIDAVFAVNPVTKATLPHLQQFVVTTAVTAHATTTSSTTLTISPPIITSGAFQTVSAVAADDATITIVGSASTGYAQNLVFRKNAFALCMVPLVKPPGANDVGRRSYKGTSVRVIPYYDGTNDASSWRLDVLYGVKTIDARQATRLSGTA